MFSTDDFRFLFLVDEFFISFSSHCTIFPAAEIYLNNASIMSTTTLNEDPKLSFWDVGGYKPNIRRIRNGAKQLEDYTQMIKERSEIEQKYGKALQNWHAKWASHVDTNVPNSIIKYLWLDLLEEGRELSQTHLSMKDRCNDEIVKTLGLFRKENYHTSIRGLRESKDMDDEFEKAQRQWKKLLEKSDSAKKAYHTACRNEKSAYIQLMNSQGDSSTTNENTDKTRDRHNKCREAVNKTRKVYEATLSEIRQFNPVYTENMTFVFEKCQQLELKRLRFAMEMLSGFENALSDLVTPLKLTQLHSSLEKKFKDISDSQLNDDLRDWSKTNGVESPLTSLMFEEYSPELRSITANSSLRRSHDDDNTGVVLTKQVIKSNELPGTPPVTNNNSAQRKTYNQCASLTKGNFLNGNKFSTTPTILTTSLAPSTNEDECTSVTTKQSISPNENEEPRQISRQAKVLYSYEPIEQDELALTKDEFVDIISGPDSLGWAFGKRSKDNMTGLFPFSYAALV
ncbi:FCH domain and SH3 domain-containing protein [Aphelenchoides bicaudatus]|nr:FCH domain and SH3 domain-containing protein [Aphelenchoides bicaudatus]